MLTLKANGNNNTSNPEDISLPKNNGRMGTPPFNSLVRINESLPKSFNEIVGTIKLKANWLEMICGPILGVPFSV